MGISFNVLLWDFDWVTFSFVSFEFGLMNLFKDSC